MPLVLLWFSSDTATFDGIRTLMTKRETFFVARLFQKKRASY